MTSSPIKDRTFLKIAIAAAFATIALTAVSLAADSHGLLDLTPQAQVGSASKSLVEAFPVLKDGAARSDAFAESLSDEPLLKSVGGNLDLAVEVETRSGKSVWLVPGNDALCVYQRNRSEFGYSGSCASAADAKAGKLALWFMNADGRDIRGVAVAPTGVSTIGVEQVNGDREEVEVVDNVAEFESDGVKSISIGDTKTEF